MPAVATPEGCRPLRFAWPRNTCPKTITGGGIKNAMTREAMAAPSASALGRAASLSTENRRCAHPRRSLLAWLAERVKLHVEHFESPSPFTRLRSGPAERVTTGPDCVTTSYNTGTERVMPGKARYLETLCKCAEAALDKIVKIR